MSTAVRLSILIPTLPSRNEFLNRLLDLLRPLAAPYGEEIEIRTLLTDSQPSVGVKRQQLLQEAKGQYIAFIDDDDMVDPLYFERIMPLLDGVNDCVGFRGIYTVDGQNPGVFIHTLKCDKWHERDGIYYRCPNHLNPVKREIALAAGFPDQRFGEDQAYSMAVRPFLKQEAMVDDPPLYLYQFRSVKPDVQ